LEQLRKLTGTCDLDWRRSKSMTSRNLK
jgi:hypothetical protein